MPRCVHESNPVVLIFEKFLASWHRLKNALLSFDSQILLNAASLCNESHQRFRLVRVELVKNEDPLPFGIGVERARDVAAEVLLRSRESDGGYDHFASGYIEVGDEAQRAMTTVFKLDAFCFTGP